MNRSFPVALLLPVLLISSSMFTYGQKEPVLVEAEAGSTGAEFTVAQDGDITYVTVSTDLAADYPGTSARVNTYSVTFPEAGNYDLYVRLRVGPQTANDDSFFYGNGFGLKDTINANDWVRANNLHTLGFTSADAYVSGAGTAGTQVWKWINLSEYTGDEAPVVFSVSEAALTDTLQIGGREDGLLIDKFAFGYADEEYTVTNLMNGEPPEPKTEDPDADTPLAHGKCKYLGCAHSSTQAVNFTKYWNQVVPENAGKWGSVEGTRDVMNWGGLDAAYKLAKENGFPFRFHVLIWGNQQPGWISGLSTDDQYDEIMEWFQAVNDRYPDIDYIEVVNEPLHDPPDDPSDGGYINALGGTGTSGFEWVLEAFRLARAIFNADLLINDYGIVNDPNATNNYLEIISALQSEGLIDGIGVQGHAFNTTGSTSTMKQNLDRLAATGLPIYVCEMDINGASDEEQLNEYKRVFPVFWEHPGVQGISLWGYRPPTWQSTAYLVESDGTERSAMVWLRDYVKNSPAGGDCPVGVEAQQAIAPQYMVYPNPVTGRSVRISGESKILSVQLFDMNGKRIMVYEPDAGEETQISLPEGVRGIVFLQIYDGQGYTGKKILVMD